jgi:hypothetical protein
MGDPVITPMLIGAGVGALGGVVTGNNPLKTAALGATIGGTGGAAGAWGGGQAAVAKGAGSSIIPQSAGAFEASMGLPNSALIASGAPMASAFPMGANAGMTAGASGNLVNQDSFIGAGTPFETYTGGEGLFSNAMGNIGSSIEDIKPYFNVQNLQGAAMVANQFQPRPMPSSSGGGISRGQAPAPALGGNIQTLLAKMPERKRISLLV